MRNALYATRPEPTNRNYVPKDMARLEGFHSVHLRHGGVSFGGSRLEPSALWVNAAIHSYELNAYQ